MLTSLAHIDYQHKFNSSSFCVQAGPSNVTSIIGSSVKPPNPYLLAYKPPYVSSSFIVGQIKSQAAGSPTTTLQSIIAVRSRTWGMTVDIPPLPLLLPGKTLQTLFLSLELLRGRVLVMMEIKNVCPKASYIKLYLLSYTNVRFILDNNKKRGVLPDPKSRIRKKSKVCLCSLYYE